MSKKVFWSVVVGLLAIASLGMRGAYLSGYKNGMEDRVPLISLIGFGGGLQRCPGGLELEMGTMDTIHRWKVKCFTDPDLMNRIDFSIYLVNAIYAH